jgi:hypothetical protein
MWTYSWGQNKQNDIITIGAFHLLNKTSWPNVTTVNFLNRRNDSEMFDRIITRQ